MSGLPVKQIKQILEAAGVDYSDCSERHELEARLAQLRANPGLGARRKAAGGSAHRGGGAGPGARQDRPAASSLNPRELGRTADGSDGGEVGAEIRRICACEDYYAVLCVQKDADDAALKKAYRKTALRLHPDKVRVQMCTVRERESAESQHALHAVLADRRRRGVQESLRGLRVPLRRRQAPQLRHMGHGRSVTDGRVPGLPWRRRRRGRRGAVPGLLCPGWASRRGSRSALFQFRGRWRWGRQGGGHGAGEPGGFVRGGGGLVSNLLQTFVSNPWTLLTALVIVASVASLIEAVLSRPYLLLAPFVVPAEYRKHAAMLLFALLSSGVLI